MRRDGVGWWISRASKNISDRGSLDAGGTQILQIHEPFGAGHRRLDRSALPHEGNHLGQTVETDLSLPGENASFRLEIKSERLPRDLVRRTGQFHDCRRYLLAIGGVAYDAKPRGESAHKRTTVSLFSCAQARRAATTWNWNAATASVDTPNLR